MDMYKLKWTTLQNEIFRLLCIKSGMSLNQRGIARALGVSPTAVGNSLGKLEKEGLIRVEKAKEMNFTSIELDKESQKAIEMKRVENLKIIYESKITDFLEEEFPGTAIILFGSYSRGEDTINSDIDIAIIGSKEKKIDLIKFDKLFERSAFLHFYPSFKEISKELKENILSGIILAGGIEL